MKKQVLLTLALCATMLAWGEDKTIIETYVNAGTGASTSRVSFKSSFDENFTVWQRGGRSKTTDVVSIDGKDVKGFWLSRQTSSSCYIEWGETGVQMLGGVKQVDFAYKQFGTENNHKMRLDIVINGTAIDSIVFDTETSSHPTHTYSKAIESKVASKLSLKNLSYLVGDGSLNGRFVIGPVTITPYLYCPSDATEMQYITSESATFTHPTFIDNTDGEAVWTCAPEGIVTVENGVVTPIAGQQGKVVITASLNDIAVSYTLNVSLGAKQQPEVTFEKDAIQVEDLYTTSPVTNKLTVTEGAGAATYTSSNPLVAAIVDNQVQVVGVGTATITATTAENISFLSGSASYTLTVAEPTGEGFVAEDYSTTLAPQSSYYKSETSFSDPDSIYSWIIKGYRYDGTELRFMTGETYWANDGVQEGGIKRLSFTWKRANGECAKIHTTIKALDGDGNEIVDRSIELAGSEDQTSNQTYNMRFDEVKQNAQFYLRNESDGFVILISDIKIIPYLLYTKKLDDVTILAGETQATYKNEAFINNTGATPTFSILSSEPANIASIADDGTVTASASGTIKVQAAWEGVTTTYTLQITKNTLPVPQVSFEDGNAVSKDMNVTGYVNTLTKDGDGEVTYESSDETVATVNAQGVITVIGEGATTITAKIAACKTYAAAEASYALTITDPKEDAYVETFERNSGGSSTNDRVGAYYTWTITTGARTRETDKLFNGTPSIWLASNGGAMETTIEGGIKRVGFLWNKFNKTATPVTVSVTAGDVERTLTKEVQTGDDYNQNNPDLVFNSNFGMKSNTKLKIANPQSTTALQIGPIAITPYIFYTQKYATLDLTQATTFTNDQLIDNRDDATAIVYSIVGANDGVASIDASTGEVTGLKAGNVTVQAAWGDVTTTYSLRVLEKWVPSDTVRILGIGNSFTMDALQQHMMPIVIGQGKKAIVGYPYRGGTWQSEHATFYNTNAKVYNYYKFDPEGNMSSTGSNSATLRGAIEDEPWDYVFIQSDHDSAGIVKSYIPHIKTLIADIKASCSNPYVKIGMYMTWAYDSTSTYKAFNLYGKNTQVMYDSIVNATKAIMEYTGIDTIMVIPAGTAIQNARTSYVGHTLNRDGYHLDYNYGRYIASLCWYNRIFGEMPKDIIYQPTTLDDYCSNMCRAAAQAAIEHPFNVTELTDYKEPLVPVVSDDDSTLVTLRVNGMNIPLVEGQKEYTCSVDQDMSTMQLWVLPTSPKASPFLYQGKADIPDTDIRGYYEVATPAAGTSTEIRIKVVAEDKIHEGNYTLILNTAEAKDITYTIASRADLEEFAAAVNRGSNTISAIQTADIDMNHTKSLSWKTPIGSETIPFKGTYNGQDYKISGFCIYSEEDPVLGQMTFVGLFGLIDHATLRNIRLSGTEECHYNREGTPAPVTIGCGILCGGMVGSLIEDCSVNMNLFTNTETGAVGLICGRDNSSEDVNIINRCYASGTWRIRRNGIYGGIIGYGYNTQITNCYSLCTMGLQRDFAARMGGIVGYAKSSSTDRAITVENCYNYGAIKDDRAAQGQATTAACALGAIAGNADGTKVQLINCYYLETSCTNAYGSGTPAAAEVTSATDAQMRDGTVATQLGSEFEQGANYPVLVKKSPLPTAMDVIRPWEESGKTKKYWSNRQIILVTPFGTYNAVGQRLQ